MPELVHSLACLPAGCAPLAQVCTACANSFAHGSNDVANSIGPLAAIYLIWNETKVAKNADVPTWILVVGGAGIVFGLATYG